MNGFILHIQGPMMSFADKGFGQLRDEGEAPSRSAVLGLIAAAMGLERGSERLLELHEQFRVHVARISPGALLVDYHTVLTAGYDEFDQAQLRREGAKGNPTLTWRSYHCDAHFMAFIECKDAQLLDEASGALADPVYTAYLGRRSCPPSMPLYPHEAEGNSLEEVFSNAYRAWAEPQRSERTGKLPWHIRKRIPKEHIEIWIDGQNVPKSDTFTHISTGFRRDMLTALPRSYVNRPVTHGRIPAPNVEPPTTNEDFFNATS